MTTTAHDLALARAERDAWQSTCEELHRTIAGRDVEIMAHLRLCDAADQRARSLDAVLTAEREAGKGLVAQVEQLRGDLQWARSRVKCAGNVEDPCGWRGLGSSVLEWEDNGETPRCPNCDEGCVEIDHAAEAHPECVGNDVAELAAIRDLVAPGNPQGAVVDAVRAMIDMDRRYRDTADEDARAAIDRADKADQERDAAIARAEKAEGDAYTMRSSAEENRGALVDVADDLLVNTVGVTSTDIATRCGAAVAKLRAELAELRTRPVLTEDLLRGALDAHGHAALARKVFAHLGPVTLPSPDRAEELCRRYHDSTSTIDIARGPAWSEYSDEGRAGRVSAMHKELTALAKLSPDPAPTFDAAFLRRVLVATKHGPGGRGNPGPCDAACVKCEAERMVKAAPAREVAPTLVAVSDEELATAYSVAHDQPIPRMAPLRDRTIAGIRAVRAKLGAAEVTEERLAGAMKRAWPNIYNGESKAEGDAALLMRCLRATAEKELTRG